MIGGNCRCIIACQCPSCLKIAELRKKIENQRGVIRRFEEKIPWKDAKISNLKHDLVEVRAENVNLELEARNLFGKVERLQAKLSAAGAEHARTGALLAASRAVRRELVRERDEAKLKAALGSFPFEVLAVEFAKGEAERIESRGFELGFAKGVRFAKEVNEYFDKEGEAFS